MMKLRVSRSALVEFLIDNQKTKFVMEDSRRCLGSRLLQNRYPSKHQQAFWGTYTGSFQNQSNYYEGPQWLVDFIIHCMQKFRYGSVSGIRLLTEFRRFNATR